MLHKTGLSDDSNMAKMTWSAIDFLTRGISENKINPPNGAAALDLFSTLLSHKLQYEAGERDMVAMHHEFGVEHSSGKKVG
jgi:alpha-aminoadipic semialdehyde synthase